MFKQVIAFVCLILTLSSQLQAQQANAESAARSVTSTQAVTGGSQTIKVPRRAGLKFVTVAPLSSATAKVGDDVPLRLVRPLVVDNLMLLPAGTVVNAKVTAVRRAHKCKDGAVHWQLDRIPFQDLSTAKSKIWTVSPSFDLTVSPRLFKESNNDELELPVINEWWEVPLAAPLYVFEFICISPLLAIVAVFAPLMLLDHSCTAPGKEYELPAGSSVAVMITQTHHVRY